MTVSELIEKLKDMPQDADVYIYADGEQKAEDVFETCAYGLFECVEIG